MDLKTDVKPEVFQLQPFANYKYRLVFDIYPAHPTDEISRLLNGLEEGSEAPDGDPLGSLLAGLDKGAAESPVKPPLEEPEPKEPVRPSRPSKPKKPSKSIKPKLIIVVDPGHGGEDLAPSAADATERRRSCSRSPSASPRSSTTIPA